MFNRNIGEQNQKWGKIYLHLLVLKNQVWNTSKNLEGSAFKFYPDPYPEQQLFYRSDNATLAKRRLAHDFYLKVDNRPNYHKVSDEIET
jgi:hypothetical protein